jgi:hypothetical protein
MKGLLIAGIVFFVGALFFWKNAYETYQVDRNGIIVPMKIEKLPTSCIGAKVPYFVTFSYQGQFFDKQTRGAFCENHHVGELVRIKYLAGSSQILFPAQSGLFELIADIAIGLFGLYLIISQCRKLWQ